MLIAISRQNAYIEIQKSIFALVSDENSLCDPLEINWNHDKKDWRSFSHWNYFIQQKCYDVVLGHQNNKLTLNIQVRLCQHNIPLFTTPQARNSIHKKFRKLLLVAQRKKKLTKNQSSMCNGQRQWTCDQARCICLVQWSFVTWAVNLNK